ncbi:MAG: RluA family pseudouridine synthase [Lachnospiraceae bacterium]|nr:RluA family pseudouridine synthase [Lachnospiraceae bacterium]
MKMKKEQILYEDNDIIVCYKPPKIAVQTANVGQRDMVSEIANYLGRPYVGIVHRLDQPVEGVLVFAKNPKAANGLSKQIAENKMEKYYYAVISAKSLLEEPEQTQKGTLVDYLYKDGKTNTSAVVSKEHQGAKRAELTYEIQNILEKEEIALVRIKLVTGRHHQIRVQMSHAGMSLLGDYKYADEETKKLSELLQQEQIALCACQISFRHPLTDKPMVFRKEPEGEIFHKFS